MTIDTPRFKELMAQYRWADMIADDAALVEKSYRAVVEYIDAICMSASTTEDQGSRTVRATRVHQK